MVTKIDEDYTKEDLLEEIQQRYPPLAHRREVDGKPIGITVKELATEQNITTQHALNQLNVLMDKGLLVNEKVRGPNRSYFVYYKAKESHS